jgi:hypothetical protein
VCYNGGE